jgi:predicted dehydrogenase/threonine dehydrogenase-like Zn-dependent dehydrogenase
MKKIIQSLNTGETTIANTPIPMVNEGELLIKTKYSLISKGTEKMLVEFGKSSSINKAKQQPDKLKAVLDKLKTDGIIPTIEAVYSKLQYPIPMGYCNLGEVIGKGNGVKNFELGDLVISNGNHAEVVSVPKQLCAKVPNDIDQKQAVFTILASVSLQGIRLAKPTLGEYFVVYGLGIIGLITVQLLRANGCRVLGIDFDKEKINLAKGYGADTLCLSDDLDVIDYSNSFSRDRGVDCVIITASSKDNSIINNAAKMCRKKGRIVLVGVTGLNMAREEFYKKELTFQVSCSYGPGRYDVNYESKGLDYPVSYVRWTQNRNFEAILDLIEDKKINFENLITQSYDFNKALDAYGTIINDKSCLGVLLKYHSESKPSLDNTRILNHKTPLKNEINEKMPGISFIGSGNYARMTLIPAFKKHNASFRFLSSTGGLSSTIAGEKYGFKKSTTDVEVVLDDTDSEAVVISTRHDSHADLILRSLQNGKDVYVEKPMCLTLKELEKIKNCYKENQEKGRKPIIMVGFNRRYSPHIIKIKELLTKMNQPKSVVMTINAGTLPNDHWINDEKIGGGRIIGEFCHFIDLVLFIVGSELKSWTRNSTQSLQDNVSIILNFKDGSIGTINYFTNGSKSYPKESLEVFCGGSVLELNNFKSLKGYGWKSFKKLNLWKQDKGHSKSVKTFLNAIRTRVMPISFDDISFVSEISIKVSESDESQK